MKQDIAEIAGKLTAVQAWLATECGDVIDSLPCKLCGARCLRDCDASAADRITAARAVNDAAAAGNGNGIDILRAHLLAHSCTEKTDG